MPLYLKTHSHGDFIYDWSWAAAYRQLGRHYYPKLMSCLPHTPAAGPRLLAAAGPQAAGIRQALIDGALVVRAVLVAQVHSQLASAAHAAGAPQDVDKLALFCAAIRRSHFEAVGGVDEGYGRGLFEDDDLCMKLSRAGHRIVLVPEVFVHHAAGATFRQLDPLEYLARFEVNRRRFERRWRRRWRAP